jgi:hypothetical protein
VKRKSIIASAAALVVAAVLVVGGFVLMQDARFAETYTAEQLSQEKISFKAADRLTEAEMAFTNARTGCVVSYAGQGVTTGRHAECFANEYMLGHLLDPEGTNQGLSFAEWGTIQSGLRAEIAEAKANNDPALAGLEEELAASEIARNSAFRGAMLRSALLTSYGFSVLGERATQAYIAAFITAGALGLLALIGFAYALATRRGAAPRRWLREERQPATL